MRTPTDLVDAITLEVNRADSLVGLLAQRLSALNERPDAPSELYALSVVADAVSDKLQIILEKARALNAGPATGRPGRPTMKKAGAR